MKNTIIQLITLCLLFTGNLFSQVKDELKTPREIIDKHLEVLGGTDNLKKINSIELLGTMDLMGSPGNIDIYFSNDAFYMNLDHAAFPITTAVNVKESYGWNKLGENVKDLSTENIYKTKRDISGALWVNYYDPQRNNVRYELLENEDVNGRNAYVIDFYQNDTLVYTQYFDTENFYMIKQNKHGQTTEYSEFTLIDDYGIYLPFFMKTPQGDVKVQKYVFNQPIDEKLLKKPE